MNGEYGGGDASNLGWLFRWQTLDIRRHTAFNGYTYTELYDVEYERAGLYTAERTLKDLGCDPAAINADAVIVFDLTPVRPGLDYLVLDGRLSLDVRISNCGPKSITGQVMWGWPATDTPQGQACVEVSPFDITEPIRIDAVLPSELPGGRLYVWLVDSAGSRRAAGVLDVAAMPAAAEAGSEAA